MTVKIHFGIMLDNVNFFIIHLTYKIMKKISLTLLLLTLLNFQSIFAQSSCQNNKSFQKGEKVYIWSSKEWGSSDKEWIEYDYDGKEGEQYKLKKVVGNSTSTMSLTSLQDVFSASEYAKLDKSKGACASCTPSYISEFNTESLKLINDYRAKNNVAALKQDPVLQKAAQDYVDWMVKNLQSNSNISHTADGTSVNDRVLKAAKSLNAVVLDDPLNGKYAFKGTGENLTSGRLCAFDAFESWRTSTSGHDWQMKNGGHQYVGMGVACGINAKGERVIFAAQVFGGEKAVQETKSDTNPTSTTTSTTTATTTGTEITMGSSMSTNQRIYSPNKEHYLVMQSDGNLVVYTKDDKPTWATDTYGKGNGCRLE